MPHQTLDPGYPQRGLREVGLPYADAGLRNALQSAYALPQEIPAEFRKLLQRLL